MACDNALTDQEIADLSFNVKAVSEWAEGGPADSATMANGRVVPSPSKLIADARLFKPAEAYNPATQYTDATVPVIESNIVYAPVPSLLPIGPEAFDPAKWYVLQGGGILPVPLDDLKTDGSFLVGQARQSLEYNTGSGVGAGLYEKVSFDPGNNLINPATTDNNWLLLIPSPSDTPHTAGAIEGTLAQDNIEAFIESQSLAGFKTIHVAGDYLVDRIDINEESNGCTFTFGTLTREPTTGAGANEMIRVIGLSDNVEGIRIEKATIVGFGQYTLDGAADAAANLLNGQNNNGIAFYGSTGLRCIDCGVGSIVAIGMGKSALSLNSVERFTGDSVSFSECGQHGVGASVTEFGAIATWASSFNPTISIGSINGTNTRTLFDVASVGSSAADTGDRWAYAKFDSVVGIDIQGRTKIQGYWELDIDTMSVFNSVWEISFFGYAAINCANETYKSLTIGSLSAENMAFGIFHTIVTEGDTYIGSLKAVNCSAAIYGLGVNTFIDTMDIRGCFSPVVVLTGSDEKVFICDKIMADNWRKQKYIDFLASPEGWDNVQLTTYPLQVSNSIKHIAFNSGVFSDIGEDLAVPPYIIAVFVSPGSQVNLKLSDIQFSNPAPFPVNTMLRTDADSRITVINCDSEAGMATTMSNSAGTGDSITLINSPIFNGGSVLGDDFDNSLASFGNRWTWYDSSNRLRITTNNTKPTDRDVDGVIVGTQS